MNTEEKIPFDFNNYIALYNTGISIKKMKPLNNQTYKVFASSNIDIRVINRDKAYRELALCPKLSFFTRDTRKSSHKYFYAVPIQAPDGTYVGFVYRTLFEHSYVSIFKSFESKLKKVPLMFGFYKDFDNFDNHKKCMPIVVCEAAKDAIMLKHLYPYVLANNTSSLGIGTQILSQITDKVILAYDNDDTGRQKTKSDKRKLQKLGISVDVLTYDEGFKDMGDYVEHPEELKGIRQQLKQKVKGLLYGTIMSV